MLVSVVLQTGTGNSPRFCLDHEYLPAVSFICWSLSFYPQPILNFRRRSTAGLTVDFPMLNLLGFICYTIFTACFLYSPSIRRQYALRHPYAPEPTVRFNDFAFALHAAILCVVWCSQLWQPRLWGFEEVKGRRASRVALGIFWGCVLGTVVTALIVWVRDDGNEDVESWAGIDVVSASVLCKYKLVLTIPQVYALSYVKLVITVCKYIPQAWFNYRRKSTDGWSITNILLDFTGGILSIVQLLIDSALEADWSGVTGNPVKFGLSNLSIFFDVIFMIQHFVLYRGSEGRKGHDYEDEHGRERRPLLENA